MKKKFAILGLVSIVFTTSAFAESDILGESVLGPAPALEIFFNNLNQMTYKKKVFSGEEKIIEVPLSQFLGDVIADTSRIASEQPLPHISQSSVLDGGCLYVINTPADLKYKVTVCTIWIHKEQGSDNLSRYTIRFKSTSTGRHGEVKVDSDSIVRTVETLKDDGSFGDLIKLE